MTWELIEFVKASLDSVWTLETLLLLREDDQRSWDKQELIRQLRSSEAAVIRAIGRLAASGLVQVDSRGHIRYFPASPELARRVADVEIEYRKAPSAVRRLILQRVDPSDAQERQP